MVSILKRNKWFYYPFIFIAVYCLITIIIFSKSSIHIFLNKFHTPFFDIFFKYLTNLGDGTVLPFLLVILIFIRFRDALLFLSVFLLSGLIVQIFKRFVFFDIVRPVEYFKGIYDLYLVTGIKQLHLHSFPSGHSATAFGYMICFAFIFKKNLLKFIMLLLACLIAYSRVYLSQHFLIDITVGSLIGIITATILKHYIGALKGKWLDLNIKLITKKMNNTHE